MALKQPVCPNCIHYKITWDKNFPRACEIFGIKSAEMPSAVVYKSTGKICPAFSQNPKIKQA